MKPYKYRLLTSLASLLLAQAANASVIDFTAAQSTWQTAYDTSSVNVIFQTNYYGWGTGYSDLVNVAYGDSSGALTIDFVALAGSTVSLSSFDLGNYLGNGAAIAYKVYDLGNLATPLLSASTSVTYSNASHATINAAFSSVTGLRLMLGSDIYNNGVDNIVFSGTPAVTVPEPTGLALAGLALGLLAVSTRARAR